MARGSALIWLGGGCLLAAIFIIAPDKAGREEAGEMPASLPAATTAMPVMSGAPARWHVLAGHAEDDTVARLEPLADESGLDDSYPANDATAYRARPVSGAEQWEGHIQPPPHPHDPGNVNSHDLTPRVMTLPVREDARQGGCEATPLVIRRMVAEERDAVWADEMAQQLRRLWSGIPLSIEPAFVYCGATACQVSLRFKGEQARSDTSRAMGLLKQAVSQSALSTQLQYWSYMSGSAAAGLQYRRIGHTPVDAAAGCATRGLFVQR